MSDETEMLASAKKFAAQFKGFMTAIEYIGGIGSIENAITEAKRKLAAVKAEEAGIVDARAAAQEAAMRQLDEARNAAGREITAMRAQKEELAAAADRERVRLAEQSAASAAAIVADAQRQASETIAAVKPTQIELDRLRDMVRTHKESHEKLTKEVDDAKARRDDILGHIAALRSKF